MNRFLLGIMVFGLLGSGAGTTMAASDDPALVPNAAQQFATLPPGVRFPEGITANPANGEVFVGTFDFGPNPNRLLRFGRNGRLAAQRDFGATPLLGLAFHSGKVYIANFGASKIQRIDASFDGATPVEDLATIPGIGAPADREVPNPDGSSDLVRFGSNSFPAPNAMAFDSQGHLYVSDSFQGAVFRIDNAATCATPCSVTLVAQDPLLATAGFPPFGANGLALSDDESVLYVANTGDDRVLSLQLGTANVTILAESINGADGVVRDGDGRLWVVANQADEVVALNGNGRVIARLGGFRGIRGDASPDGLLFPASAVIVGSEMFVTNLALPLTAAGGDEPEEDVERFTVSRLKLPNR